MLPRRLADALAPYEVVTEAAEELEMLRDASREANGGLRPYVALIHRSA